VFEGIVNVETVTDKKGNPLYDANGRERQIRECSGYLLSTPENLAAYKGLADRVNNGTGRRLIDKIETRIKLRYCIPANKNGEKAVYIPPRLLQFGAAAAVAGPRAANAAALAAAGLPVRGAAAAVSEAGRNANAAAAAAAAASTTNANETILPTEYNRNTYVGLMTTMPDIEAAIARQELTYEDAKRMYEEEWNDAKVKQNASNAEFARSLAASRGGSRRTHRSRSLRAKRRHTSKAKGHGRRHHSRKH
jgi:hypothetical protein